MLVWVGMLLLFGLNLLLLIMWRRVLADDQRRVEDIMRMRTDAHERRLNAQWGVIAKALNAGVIDERSQPLDPPGAPGGPGPGRHARAE
jgi:hypothetical protein